MRVSANGDLSIYAASSRERHSDSVIARQDITQRAFAGNDDSLRYTDRGQNRRKLFAIHRLDHIRVGLDVEGLEIIFSLFR